MHSARSQSNAALEETVRQAGFKVTPARLTVLKAMRQANKPLSVQEIYGLVEQDGVDRVTVYRMVKSFVAANIIQQIDFHHRHALFELMPADDHHHVVCVQCDRTVDVEKTCGATMDKEALAQSGFASISKHSLEFFGVCKQCAA